MSRDAKVAVAATAGTLVVAVVAVLLVDARLDRQVPLRVMMLMLALLCAAVLATGRRPMRRGIGIVGLVLWGAIAPLSTTAWSSPPEIDFGKAVVDDATQAAQRDARSVVTVEDIRTAVQARGGAVGTLPRDGAQVAGADEFPLVVRPDPARARPRVCIWISNGSDAAIRHC
jgi:hypothetical protein